MDTQKVQQDFGVVYKYVTPERVDILRNSSIRFTQPIALNDPFEFLRGWVHLGSKCLRRHSQRVERTSGTWGSLLQEYLGLACYKARIRHFPKCSARHSHS
jgi:hypothetical protein